MDAHRIGAGLFEDRPSFLPHSPECVERPYGNSESARIYGSAPEG
jgi:hypothetical protein